MKADNAVIMAAGTASRFAPISYERPKALIEVRGEILIERQIRQLKKAGISDISVVTGYKAGQFEYLKDRYGVKTVYNPEYLTRNNNSSIYAVKDSLKNTYICSSDNYFLENPFIGEPEGSYYAAVYMDGKTDEWCIRETGGRITDVSVGGENSWVMMGHVFWSEGFSRKFTEILVSEYDRPETAGKLWETIYIEHIDELNMNIRKYPPGFIFEFDTLDELRTFDGTYMNDTRSEILKNIAARLGKKETNIRNIRPFKNGSEAATGFTFYADGAYRFYYDNSRLERV